MTIERRYIGTNQSMERYRPWCKWKVMPKQKALEFIHQRHLLEQRITLVQWEYRIRELQKLQKPKQNTSVPVAGTLPSSSIA